MRNCVTDRTMPLDICVGVATEVESCNNQVMYHADNTFHLNLFVLGRGTSEWNDCFESYLTW